MKIKRTTLLILGLFILAGLTTLLIKLHDRGSSGSGDLAHNQPAASIPVSIPPAPPPRSPPDSHKSIASRPSPPTSTNLNMSDTIFYDDTLSFEDNLKRLKEFCHSHESDQRLEQLLGPFVSVVLEKASQQFAAVKSTLDNLDGPAAYRNILLGCLMASDGSSAEKASIVWRIALNAREPVEVRRTATYLTSQVEDYQKRSADMFALLADTDSQIVISALANSTRHLDENGYNLIKNILIYSPDINLRVAAVSALGRSSFPDNQVTLREIVTSGQTTKEDAFSEASLPKRAAIPHLDMHNPETYDLVKTMALNENEDPGVRAKAISRFTPAEFPEATAMLLQLLQKLDADNTVPLRAVVDTLLTSATPERIQAIRTRAAELSDPQVRTLILKRTELATKGENP